MDKLTIAVVMGGVTVEQKTVRRGSTPTISIEAFPGSSTSISSMGDWVVGISQNLVYLKPETEVSGGSVSVTLSEEDTLKLAAGTMQVQALCVNGDEVLRLAVHDVTVEDTITGAVVSGE